MSHAYKRVRRGTLALAMLLALTYGHSSAQWTEAPSLSTGRVLAQQAYANGKIYVAGGSTASTEIGYASYPTSSVSSATILNSPGGTSWTAASPMSTGRTGGYAAAINGKIYIVGGHTSVTQTAFTFADNTLEFDPANNTYTPKAGPLTPVTGAAGATVGTKIYLFGGLSLDDNSQLVVTNLCQVYDVTTNTWQQYSTPAPYAAFYATATANGQTIYLIGGTGLSNGSAVALNSAYKGTVTANNITWTAIKNYPIGVSSAAAGTLNGKVYVAGGELPTGTATNKVYRYDEAGNKWDFWYSLPVPESNVSSLVNDGTSLFYISGSNSKSVYKLSDGAATAVAALDQNAFYVTTTTGVSKNVTFHLTNNGVAPLEGSINIPSDAQAWASTQSGTFTGVGPGTSKTLTIAVGGAGVNPGNYHTTVMVTTNDAAHAQVPVDIYFYVRDQLPQQPTRVVVEEGTGTWCGWCPYGHQIIDQAVESLGADKVIPMAYHGPTNDQTSGYYDPYTIAQGYALLNNLGLQGYPNASIQRWQFPGESFQMTDRNVWETYINQVLAQQPIAPMAMKILSYQYNSTTKEVTAKVQITTAQAIPMSANTKIRLSAILTQDSLNHVQTQYIPQTDGSVQTVHNDPYAQRHVVRAMFPDQYGVEMQIPDGGTEENVLLPGTVFTQEITFTASATTDVPRSAVTFVVHRTEAGNKLMEIYQGERLPLTANISEGGANIAVNTPTATMQIGTNDTAAFTTTVQNSGTAPATLTVTRTETALPTNWTTWFCVEENCTSTSETEKGPITVAPGETKHITVHINGTSSGSGHVTLHLDYGSGQGTDQQYTATVQGAGVDYPSTGTRALRLGQNTPNPAATVTSFDYLLPSSGTVAIDIFNMRGEKINSFSQNGLEAGAHSFEIDVTNFPSGTYSVRLSSNGSSVSRLFNVTR